MCGSHVASVCVLPTSILCHTVIGGLEPRESVTTASYDQVVEEREIATVDHRVDPDDWDSVIEDTDGYQIVVAGPGTGKTELLVRRVAHLIESGAARRDEILLLCFSRRASGDLRRRIEDRIGAPGVPVDTTTFHSLALRLIEAVSSGTRPVPLTTPEQVGVVADLLEGEDPASWPLTYRGILTSNSFAAEVADFLMRCSERLLSPDDLARAAAERADWRGLPGLYDRYLQHLEATGRTDYGVLLTKAVEALEAPSGRSLAERFRYVLVDEYQDTTPVQAAMALLLAGPEGNLTVTGDPYQSIYSFRGAELRNVADFTRDGQARRYVLTKSFRVPGAILDSALRVVSGGSLPGAAGHVDPAPHEGRVETYVFDQETAEAEWIAREVERAVEVEGIKPSSVAVLVRSKRELLNELSRALHRRGISHDAPDSRLVDHPAVRLIHDLVMVASAHTPEANPVVVSDVDRAMRRVFLGPLVAMSLGAERSILRHRRRTGESWAELIRHTIDRPGLADLIEDGSWADQGAAVDGFWHVWSSLEGIDELVDDPARAEWRRAWSAFAQVLGRQAERDPRLSLRRFFQLSDDEDFESTPLLSHLTTDERVTLTTLHQAKGLEFDIVFIANAVEGVFPDLRRSRRMLRPELLSPERTTDPHAQHRFQVQEEMRLAYTAMTRARMRVVWTATDAGVDQGEHRPSRFLIAASGAAALSEIGPPAEVAQEPVTIAEAEVFMRRDLADPAVAPSRRLAALALLGRPGVPWWDISALPGVPLPGPDTPILGDAVRLSPSQADSYRRCPRQYAMERRLRLGDATSPYAKFGSLVHAALEDAESEIVGSGLPHADVGRALQSLERVWVGADFGTAQLNGAWLDKARDLVAKLYERWPTPDGTPVELETRVHADIGGVEWVGVIDRVERTETGERVVDYKTSATPLTKDEAARSIQLAFYVAALARSGRRPIDAQLWYPRTQAKSVTTRSLDMSALDEIEEEMGQITDSVLAEDWTPRPGDHCERCSFRLSCPAWPEGRGAYLP